MLHQDRIHAALQRPYSYINYSEGCDIHTICAVLLSALASDHPFTEGNKRTALLTTLLVYEVNGIKLHFSLVMNEEYTNLVLWVVEENPKIEEIAVRLKELVERFEPSMVESLLNKLGTVIARSKNKP